MKLFSYLQSTHGISRREFMQMLKEKAVSLDSQVVESVQGDVNVGQLIEIRTGGKLLLSEKAKELAKKKKMIVLFNKPKGYTVAKEDKHNKTVYELLPKSWQKDFFYIGRLDKDSHGLLLLTNDPALVDYYEKPENNVHKIYEVEIDQAIKSQHILKAKKGIPVDADGTLVNSETGRGDRQTAEILKVVNIRYQSLKQKHFATVTLNEGKKRHIRRLFKALGYRVKDLKRVKVGKYQLGTIKPGKYMMQPYK